LQWEAGKVVLLDLSCGPTRTGLFRSNFSKIRLLNDKSTASDVWNDLPGLNIALLAS
jgi:hypothetical protein